MYENVCSIPLTADLISQALHATEPVLAVGLASGHVQSFRLPAIGASRDADDEGAGEEANGGKGGENTSILSVASGSSIVDTEWRTRRHKGSCRSLAYSHDGEVLYSAGTDGLIKAASAQSGQVFSKLVLRQRDASGRPLATIAQPFAIQPLSPQTLIVATEDRREVHVFDLRDAKTFATADTGCAPVQTFRPHEQQSRLTALAPMLASEQSTSGFAKQWVTAADTDEGAVLAITDLRRGVIKTSEEIGDELLACTVLPTTRRKGVQGTTAQKFVLGSCHGYVNVWEQGEWAARIKVDRSGETVDCIAAVPENVAGTAGRQVVVGLGDGTCRFVDLVRKSAKDVLLHQDQRHGADGVLAVGFDTEGRLITGAGMTVKVWDQARASNDFPDSEDETTGNDLDVAHKKRGHDLDSDASDSDAAIEAPRRNKQKKKGNKKQNGSGNGIIGLAGL